MPGDLTPDQVSFFVILIVAFALLITEKLRNDIVAVMIILALFATGLLSEKDAVSGFSSEPALVVAAIFVLSAALHQTGVSDAIGSWIGRLAGSTLTRAILVIMPSVAALSAFTHHLTTTAIMLPVTMKLSREREIPPSKLLMPLSFAASLGTTITIIGAPAFLIASGILQESGNSGLGIFSIAPIGLALSLVGTLFIALVGRFLLPARRGSEDLENRYRLAEYFTEVKVLEGGPFEGKTVEELEADGRHDFTVVHWLRDGRARYHRSSELSAGDVLLVRAAPEQIVAFRQQRGVELHPVEQYAGELPEAESEPEDVSDQFVQAIVAPNSDFIGRTIAELDFRRRYGVIVVSLWRSDGWLQQELARIRLRAGDVLVLQGNEDQLSRLERERSVLMLLPFQGELHARRKAPLAAAIMVATVAAAAVDVMMATIGGALAMVLGGCITPRQAYRAIDGRIFVFIAGAIPLGVAMKTSGSSDLLAGWMQRAVGGWNQLLVLFILFWIVAILTQFMSDAATTALFAPVAVALAQALGASPTAFVVTVAMAAVASFLTPIGHHGNLLIYGPGGYRFADFVRVGTPLTLLVSLIVIVMAPMLWS